MQSYNYEVVVSEKVEIVDGERRVVRKAEIIDQDKDFLEKPVRFKLLLKNASRIMDLGVDESEVSVNIVPFLGKE